MPIFRLKFIVTSLKCLAFLLLLFALTEVLLRVFHFGTSTDLFKTCNNNPALLELNAGFEQLQTGGVKCESRSSIKFKRVKDENTFRIFVLGPATFSTEPVNPNSEFSHILHQSLQSSFPGKNTEVINISLKSASSFSQYNIVRQLKKYQPDLVLICPGSDELYSASKNHQEYFFGNSVWFNRLKSHFMNLRLAQGINQLTLHRKTVSVNYIGRNDGLRKNAMECFEVNLSDMVALLQGNGIAVILMNNSSNMLDQPPLKSCYSSMDSTWLKRTFAKGETAYKNGELDLAFSHFSEVYQKERGHAATCYYLGQLALKDGDKKKAARLLQQAVNLDKIPLRASDELNKIIFKVAAVRGCPLIDVDKIFSACSISGIPGNNLFSGPKKPNLSANILMAGASYRLIKKYFNSTYAIEDQNKELSVSPFDTIYDQICTEAAFRKWKTEPVSNIDSQSVSTSFEEITAHMFAEEKVDWEQSMNALYEHYIQTKNYKSAFKIIENLALENPYEVEINANASKIASLLGDSQMVVHYANKAYAVQPDLDIAQRLFINYLKLDMPESALPYLVYVRKYNKTATDYNLIYATTCEIIDLRKLLQSNPGDQELKNLIANRYKAMGNYEAALKYIPQ